MIPDFALHITWTCYGTRLPGDNRGYVSNTLREDDTYERKKNIPGDQISAGDARTWNRAKQLQKSPTVDLNAEQALCVANELANAAKKRGWRILRAAVIANHIHVVVTECPDDGPAVRRILKGTTQAALNRQAGEPRSWYTQGGSDRYKHGDEAVQAAIEYVANQDGILAEIVDMVVSGPRQSASNRQ